TPGARTRRMAGRRVLPLHRDRGHLRGAAGFRVAVAIPAGLQRFTGALCGEPVRAWRPRGLYLLVVVRGDELVASAGMAGRACTAAATAAAVGLATRQAYGRLRVAVVHVSPP